MSLIRLGAVGYLNARPLVHGLHDATGFSLRFDVPARCADLLHEDAIDLGLIPSIEYLRGPGTEYTIVPDLAIASDGPVASVAIYTTKPIESVRSIALDTSSRTSVALVRVLCARVFHIEPALQSHQPDLSTMLAECDAALIIGDNALVQESGEVAVASRAGTVHGAERGGASAPGTSEDRVWVHKIDLGEVWRNATGLPFVYAFWAGRSGAVDAAAVDRLQQARDSGMAATAEIAATYFPGAPSLQAVGERYLRDNIKYSMGAAERAGLELFYQWAADAGAVNHRGELRFF
jgi:chorismate dehydratase